MSIKWPFVEPCFRIANYYFIRTSIIYFFISRMTQTPNLNALLVQYHQTLLTISPFSTRAKLEPTPFRLPICKQNLRGGWNSHQ